MLLPKVQFINMQYRFEKTTTFRHFEQLSNFHISTIAGNVKHKYQLLEEAKR